MLGSPLKKLQKEEIDMRNTSRKSLHLANDLPINQVIFKKDLELKRPGNGLSFKYIDFFIGKKTTKALKKGHMISLGDAF